MGGEASHIGPTELGPHGQVPPLDEGGQQRVRQRRRRSRRAVDELDVVALLGSQHGSDVLEGLLDGAVGREPVVHGQHGSVGHDVARRAPGPIGTHDPTLDPNGLQCLAVLAAVEHRPALLVGGQPLQDRRQAVHGVAAHPWARRVGPLPVAGHRDAHGSLAPGLDGTGRRLTEERGVGHHQVGPFGEQSAQAVVLRTHLLGVVEHVGDVDGRLRHGARQLEEHGQPRLHVGGAQPPQRVGLEPGRQVGVDRHRVGVAGQRQPLRSAELRPGHEVVAQPVDDQPRGAGTQLGLEAIGEGCFVEALRRDVDQLGREPEQVGQTVAP